jgi:hypothetical protein
MTLTRHDALRLVPGGRLYVEGGRWGVHEFMRPENVHVSLR